jgi:hypothetical protein
MMMSLWNLRSGNNYRQRLTVSTQLRAFFWELVAAFQAMVPPDIQIT